MNWSPLLRRRVSMLSASTAPIIISISAIPSWQSRLAPGFAASEIRAVTLDGRAALVTGASSGTGAAIVEALARDGASVTINYFRNEAGARELAGKVEAAGRRALVVQADVRHRVEVKRLVAAHLARFHRLDILVTNPGDMIKPVAPADTA